MVMMFAVHPHIFGLAELLIMKPPNSSYGFHHKLWSLSNLRSQKSPVSHQCGQVMGSKKCYDFHINIVLSRENLQLKKVTWAYLNTPLPTQVPSETTKMIVFKE